MATAQKSNDTKFKETEIGTIPEEWDVAVVEDFCSSMTSGGTPSRERKEFYINGTIPWVKTKELNDSYIYDTEEKITEDAIKKSAAKVLPKDTVSMAMYGATVGMLGILGIEASTNQACCNMVANKDSDFKYLFYSLLNKRQELIGRANGAAQQNLSVGTIKNFPLAKPIYGEQKQISEILSFLDDKIEINRKINTNLEKLAAALFKKWFVDIGDELPDGWRMEKLGDVVNIVYGKGLPTDKLLETGYPVFGGNGVIGFYDKYLYEEPQVIIGCRGAASGNIKQTYPKSFVTNNSLVLEIPIDSSLNRFYLKKFLQTVDITAHVTGSAQPQITIENLRHLEIVMPPDGLLTRFAVTASWYDQLSLNNEYESKNLSIIRDSLLPRLMSGKIRVNPNFQPAYEDKKA